MTGILGSLVAMTTTVRLLLDVPLTTFLLLLPDLR